MEEHQTILPVFTNNSTNVRLSLAGCQLILESLARKYIIQSVKKAYWQLVQWFTVSEEPRLSVGWAGLTAEAMPKARLRVLAARDGSAKMFGRAICQPRRGGIGRPIVRVKLIDIWIILRLVMLSNEMKKFLHQERPYKFHSLNASFWWSISNFLPNHIYGGTCCFSTPVGILV